MSEPMLIRFKDFAILPLSDELVGADTIPHRDSISV